MFRYVFLTGLAASAIYLATESSAEPQAPSPSDPVVGAPNEVLHQPVLLYSLAGGTLTGTLHTQLTVYSSGFATIARFDEAFVAPLGEYKAVKTTYLDARDIRELGRDLQAAGALTLVDQQQFAADIPLNTVTVFQGGQVNTFNYWTSSGAFEPVNQTIDAFIATHFPNV